MKNAFLLTLLVVVVTGCNGNGLGLNSRPGPDEVAEKVVADYYAKHATPERVDIFEDQSTGDDSEEIINIPPDQRLENPRQIGNNGREDSATDGSVRYYQIAAGDNFWNIAGKQLGDHKRWAEIQKLNPSVEKGKLKIGMKIKLPAK